MSIDSMFDKLTFTKARFIFLWLLLFSLIFTIIYGILQYFFPFLPNFEDPIVNQILYSCSFISLCFYLTQQLNKSKISSKHILGNLRPSYSWLALFGWAVIFLLFSVGSALISFHGLSLIAPEVHESFLKSISDQESRISAFPIVNQCWQTINYVAVAPITEEFIFRGVLLHRLAMKWNLPVAIWTSSIIFGLLHPNPVGISVLGVAWALIYIKTKTLVVPIIAHCMNNTIVVLGEWVSTFGEQASTSSNVTGNEWIVGILLITISLPLICGFIYRLFPAKNKPLPYFSNQVKATQQ